MGPGVDTGSLVAGVWLLMLLLGGGLALAGVRARRVPGADADSRPLLEETRRFSDPPELVIAAYRAGVGGVPGLSIVQEGGGWLLLSGGPGPAAGPRWVLQVRVAAEGTGSRVVLQYAPAPAADPATSADEASYREQGRALRRAARRLGGLTESA